MNSTAPKAKKVKQKLIQVHRKVLVVGVLPTSGSNGQFCVQDAICARPPRHRRQRGIDQEVRGLRGTVLIEAVSLGPALGEIVMQQRLRDLAAQRRDRRGDRVGNGRDRLGQIDALKLDLHRRLDRRLLFRGQIRQRLAGSGLGDVLFGQRREPDEVGGRVILPEIRPHAVEAAVIHEIGFLKAGLAGLDVGSRHEERAVGRDETVGKGRRSL